MENIDAISYSSFGKQNLVRFSQPTLLEKMKVGPIAILDTFLIVSDLSGKFNLKLFGSNSKKLITSLIARGDRSNEMINVSNIVTTTSNSSFWAYDETLNKLLKINLFKALKYSNYIPEREFTLHEPLRGIASPNWISDETFAGTSFAFDDCRFLTFNVQSKLTRRIGKMPDPAEDWPQQSSKSKLGIAGMTYTALLRKHPDEDKYVILYNTTDRIELYQHNKLVKIVSGPDQFPVVTAFAEQGQGVFVPIRDSLTKYAFLDVNVTKKYIYTLYAGKDDTRTSKILVYDWNCNPYKIYSLNRQISTFALKENHNRVTIFSYDDGKLFTTNLY